MSISLGIFVGIYLLVAVPGFALFLWLIDRIHPLSRRSLALVSLGLGISLAAMFWQGYQRYVLDASSVSIMTRVLSFVGIAVLVSGVYLHSLERQKTRTGEGG